MKVVAFNGSPRWEGNTDRLIRKVLSVLEAEGIETEIVHIGGRDIHGCTACMRCREMRNERCKLETDKINEYIQLMKRADGIIIGSPTYFADITPETKALIDRAGYVMRANGNMLRRKVGAAVVAERRAGGIHAYDTINHFFGISEMVTVGSSYWNLGFGLNPGDVDDDPEGMKTMEDLGKNMAWLLKAIARE
ncbi:MAG: flavodoxin family protein [Candidatus Methanofastidiosa archaeon]|nr:flavodoxin family protein [Candidatus Methanofastidiosa archaeon]